MPLGADAVPCCQSSCKTRTSLRTHSNEGFPSLQEADGLSWHRHSPCRVHATLHSSVTAWNSASLPPWLKGATANSNSPESQRGCTVSWHPHVLKWASAVYLGSCLQGIRERSPTPLRSGGGSDPGLWLLPIGLSGGAKGPFISRGPAQGTSRLDPAIPGIQRGLSEVVQ